VEGDAARLSLTLNAALQGLVSISTDGKFKSVPLRDARTGVVVNDKGRYHSRYSDQTSKNQQLHNTKSLEVSFDVVAPISKANYIR